MGTAVQEGMRHQVGIEVGTVVGTMVVTAIEVGSILEGDPEFGLGMAGLGTGWEEAVIDIVEGTEVGIEVVLRDMPMGVVSKQAADKRVKARDRRKQVAMFEGSLSSLESYEVEP